ncbi:hypothetical protein ANN_13971 [Periplaneta americana]|uniref:Uncharacterized protein n=1 Tax=Periplaneta americana TaxID=6978 RepID=A0ABQ8SWJ4_PERAM|nr:hypothetical protein ANN_13971 [Periplaneta americana]
MERGGSGGYGMQGSTNGRLAKPEYLEVEKRETATANLTFPATQEVLDSSSGVTPCIVMKNDGVLYHQVSLFSPERWTKVVVLHYPKIVERRFRQQWPEKQPPDRHTITTWHRNLLETGSLVEKTPRGKKVTEAQVDRIPTEPVPYALYAMIVEVRQIAQVEFVNPTLKGGPPFLVPACKLIEKGVKSDSFKISGIEVMKRRTFLDILKIRPDPGQKPKKEDMSGQKRTSGHPTPDITPAYFYYYTW